MIEQYQIDLLEKKIDLIKLAKIVETKIKKINKEYHYFNIISSNIIEQAKKVQEKINNNSQGKLAGLFVSIKDNLWTKDLESTASSQILKGFEPLEDSEVVKQLKEQDAIIIGKTSMDAFGFGSFNINVGKCYEIPLNPLDNTRVTGGSSGGSAGITAMADFAHISIAESTGGSIECPASFCGVIGFCPTYGKVSRYGLISYANSLDKIGIMSKEVKDLKPVLDIISTKDPKDATSLDDDFKENKNKKYKVGIIKEFSNNDLHKDVKNAFDNIVSKLKENKNIEIDEISLPIVSKYALPSYYLISMSEASTNLACFSGLRYGKESIKNNKSFTQYFKEIRSENFNQESKRRIMLGTFARMSGYRDAYYIKATKVRTKIIQEYKELFKEYDVLISPTMPVIAPKIEEAKNLSAIENYMMDNITVGPNLAGVPHATIPIETKNNQSIGLMAITNHLEEYKLIDFLKIIEDLK